MKENVFNNRFWFLKKYDGRRKKFFCQMTKEGFCAAKEKHIMRELEQLAEPELSRFQRVKRILKIFSEIPYKYEGDGWDDFNKYQRPSSNGVGYVAICPGEKANNIYIDDPVAVAILKRKYNEFFKK